jgi:hypothetical protein
MAEVTTITVPWTRPVPPDAKGIVHVPVHKTPMTPSLDRGRRSS